MINIKDKNGLREVYFPKMRHLGITECNLVLRSELTLEEYEFFPIDDGCLNDYYIFALDFSDVKDGEYRYTINTVDNGLIRIGEIKADKVQINKKETYIQFNG